MLFTFFIVTKMPLQEMQMSSGFEMFNILQEPFAVRKVRFPLSGLSREMVKFQEHIIRGKIEISLLFLGMGGR